ncbi:MAG: glucose-6-phosphate dehydrogenase, partial [Candidatus Paceibacterota bacterium]
MSTDTKFSLPTVFVLFGITGDLVRRKILLSLYSLYCKNLLPEKLQIYGFSRRDFDDESLRNYLRTIMQESSFGKKDKYEEFLNKFYYVRGNFTECSGYEELAGKLGHLNDEWRVCANKLFYLAVPPKYYKSILNNLSDTDLTEPCSSKEGFTRVVLEKPCGRDLQTARSLDELLGKLFKEEQIYRVDHYLGKETVQNVFFFRF